MVAVDRTRLGERAGAGDAGAARVQRLVERLSYHLSGAQLGITITSLVLGLIAEPAVATVLEPGLEPLFGASSTGASIVVALALATVLQMVMGELVPKTVATSRPLRTAVTLARPVAIYGILARPMVAFLDGTATAVVRRLGIEPREDIESTPDRGELEQMIVSSGSMRSEISDRLVVGLPLANITVFGMKNAPLTVREAFTALNLSALPSPVLSGSGSTVLPAFWGHLSLSLLRHPCRVWVVK